MEKCVLVTGASRGIGRAIIQAFGQQSDVLMIGTATSGKGADAISTYLHENNMRGKGYVLDITTSDGITQVLGQIREDFSTQPTILVNNAGIVQDNLLLRMRDEEWAQVINTNLNGVYRVTKSCLRAMIKARFGRIITIGSVSGVMGNPGQCNYAAAKAGIIGFSKALAREVAGRAITVNVIAPGFVDTEMTEHIDATLKAQLCAQIPAGRFAKAEEIGQAVVYLASDHASYITGSTLHINGGLYMT